MNNAVFWVVMLRGCASRQFTADFLFGLPLDSEVGGIHFSETSVNFIGTTRRYDPEETKI
jgi:hypothetical protein